MHVIFTNALYHTIKIFRAFEQHQFYKLPDLVKRTNQPVNYVKNALAKIATYRTAPPHKGFWELKPEYRNYAAKKEDMDADD